jgi:VanZ family protein
MAFAALITVLCCLCSVKLTDSSWLLTAAIGAAIGAAGLHGVLQSDFRPGGKHSVPWWIAAFAFGVIVAGFFLHPWRFDASAELASSRWENFFQTPFAAFHSGGDWQVIDEIARKLAWFGGWGIVLGHAVCRTTGSRLGRWIGAIIALSLAAATGLLIEWAQLRQTNHSGEITDVVTYACGAFAGIWLRLAWLNSAEGTSPFAPRTESFRGAKADAAFAGSPPRAWSALLQTALAVGLAAGLLIGVALLYLRR